MSTTKRPDRRVKRTTESLHTALMQLILEKSYDKITIQDLIDRADIGRSTFYAHYETKDDLLVSGLDRLTRDLKLHLADDPSGPDAMIPSVGLFRHVADNREMFKALFGSKGIDIVMAAGHETLISFALERIEARDDADDPANPPPDVRAAFVAGALMAFLNWWLDNDLNYPPDQMAQMYSDMTQSV